MELNTVLPQIIFSSFAASLQCSRQYFGMLSPPLRWWGPGSTCRELEWGRWGRPGSTEEQNWACTDVHLCLWHFGLSLGRAPLCFVTLAVTRLTLPDMNFSDPAVGTSPVHGVGQGPFPRVGEGTSCCSGSAAAAMMWVTEVVVFFWKMFRSEPSVLLKWGTWDMNCLFLLNTHSVVVLSAHLGSTAGVVCNGRELHTRRQPKSPHHTPPGTSTTQVGLICPFVPLVTSKPVSSSTQWVSPDQITRDPSQMGHPVAPVLSD